MRKKPSIRPQISRTLAMKRLQTPPVIEATMLTTAVKPCSSNEEVMYGFRLDWTAERSNSTNCAMYRLGTRCVSTFGCSFQYPYCDLRDKHKHKCLLVPDGSDGFCATDTVLLDLAIGIIFGRRGKTSRRYRNVPSVIFGILTREFSRGACHVVLSVVHGPSPGVSTRTTITNSWSANLDVEPESSLKECGACATATDESHIILLAAGLIKCIREGTLYSCRLNSSRLRHKSFSTLIRRTSWTAIKGDPRDERALGVILQQ